MCLAPGISRLMDIALKRMRYRTVKFLMQPVRIKNPANYSPAFLLISPKRDYADIRKMSFIIHDSP